MPLSVFAFLQIEICNYNQFVTMEKRYIVTEIAFIFFTFLILDLIVNHVFITSSIVSICYFLIAIVNHYVYQFRSIPLIPTDLELANTAWAVLDHYTISISKQAGISLCLFLLNSCVIFYFSGMLHRKKRRRVKRMTDLLIAIVFIGVLQIPFSERVRPYMNISTITWNVQTGYWQYGYLLGSIQNAKESKVNKPEKYDKAGEIIEKLEVGDNADEKKERADVILILNESYFDLYSICNFKTNKNPTEFFDELSNVKRGYFVNPNTVTGNSEFEILTSNSVELISSMTAFTHFSLNNSNSVVKNFKELGYETYAIHPSFAENYNRLTIYPELGFEHLNWLEDFPDGYSSVSGYPSDEACFEKIIELYEQDSKKENKFIYNLTIQNHGGYDRGIEDKSIEVIEGIKEPQKSLVEEYLSRLSYTDEAFRKRIHYFRKVDKQVIVCMLGGHGPYFIDEIANKEFLSAEDQTVKTRATPFIIWSNYPIKEENIGYSSMIYTMPILFETAGLPMTEYQKYLLRMQEAYPIITVGFYGDGRQFYSYDLENEHKAFIDDYFVLEYENLIGSNEYMDMCGYKE